MMATFFREVDQKSSLVQYFQLLPLMKILAA